MVGVGTVVDAAIGWLVQSILGNIFTEKLEAWTNKVGLADEVEKLKSDMRYVQMVVVAAKGRRIENEPLAQSLVDLKELLYDADDVMDGLDYYRLQEQVTSDNARGGDTTAAANNTITLSTWSPSFINQLGSTLGKRKRENNHNIAANTNLGNKSEVSHRKKYISSKLRDLGRDVGDALRIDGSNFTSTSNLCTHQDKRLTTSYLFDHKVFGRDVEKESILKLMATNRSDDITVVPIVGVGGIGKTTLAQVVYNDPTVGSRFQVKIWLCVSDNFDLTRLTREMVDYFPTEQMEEKTDNLNKLQENLLRRMGTSRFLVVLDDVWDDMNLHCWETLLAPLKRNQTMGNMIVVTTRKLSVAEMTRTRTIKPVKLGALDRDDFWKLFTSCVFGDEKHEQHPSLYTIGKRIAEELRGSPLAAKTVGTLLRRNISLDNWTNILKNEEWKSLHESGGIMPALKLSYDYLPDHLQQCFRYCCLFPKDYHFGRAQLVGIWISQGFVHGSYTGKNQEDIGEGYLADLVNSGFFQHVFGSFVMHDLMHDLARQVSSSEIAIIDSSECKRILPTTRHLSILANHRSFKTDPDGNVSPHENFQKKLLQVTSVKKLRSLVMIGPNDPWFLKYFEDKFKEAQNLRFLFISGGISDFDCLVSSLVSCTHIRYINVDHWHQCRISEDCVVTLPQSLIKMFHLEVLELMGFHANLTLPDNMNNLVNMRHLSVRRELHSTIAGIGNMTALQELSKFKVQNSSRFDIKQLQSMNQLVELGIYQLENVRDKQEASEARLTDKGHLNYLHLSWDSGSTSFGTSAATTTEVLEGLKPHQNLKHLQITGYNGSFPPSWLSDELSVTSLQMLRLENCKDLRILPHLKKLLFLRKLILINIWDLVEVSIPFLEELELIDLPSLEKCFAADRRALNFAARVLILKNCPELKYFTPFRFQNIPSVDVEQTLCMPSLESTCGDKEFSSAEADRYKKWLSSPCNLEILECPRLMMMPPVPPTANTRVSIQGLPMIPSILCDGSLSVKSSDELKMLDGKILEFQNLTKIKSLHIEDCPNLMSISPEGIKQLLNLRELKIVRCGNLVSSTTMVNAAAENQEASSYPTLPHLTRLKIESCGGIAGKWLTELLPLMQSLEKLYLKDCPQIKSVSIDHHGQMAEHVSFGSSSECQVAKSTWFSSDEFHLHIPLNVLATLKKLYIDCCPQMELCRSTEGFGGFTSLVRLKVSDCPMLLSSVGENFSFPPSIPQLWITYLPAKLQPYFLENQTSLKKLQVWCAPDLQSLRLHSCTALEELNIYDCGKLAVLEGVECLSSLKRFEVEMNPELSAAWVGKCQNQEEGIGGHTCLLPPSLVELGIANLHEDAMPYLLDAHLPSLYGLAVHNSPNLMSLQIGSLTGLRFLKIDGCDSLTSLEGLQSLGNLLELEIFRCGSIAWPCFEFWSRQEGDLILFPRLERLKIDDFSALTTSFCKHLTSLTYLRLGNSFSNQSGLSSSRLTDEQGEALQLLKSLKELLFMDSKDLVSLPAVLHRLSSLEELVIRNCPCISRLPETGLPPSLEFLEIHRCSAELNEHCRVLTTEKLKVRIDDKFVN